MDCGDDASDTSELRVHMPHFILLDHGRNLETARNRTEAAGHCCSQRAPKSKGCTSGW